MVEPDFDTEPDTDPEVQTEEEAQRSFTGKKMHLMDAIDFAFTLTPTQKLIARRLLQHADKNTWLIYPSQGRLAAQLGLSEDTVKRAIKVLVKANWIVAERPNRQQTNQYRFTDLHINAVFEAKDSRLEQFALDRQQRLLKRREKQRARSSDRADTPPQESLTGQDCHFATGQDCHFATGQIRPLNTFKEHREGTPEEGRGMEQGNSNSDTREAETQREVNSDDR